MRAGTLATLVAFAAALALPWVLRATGTEFYLSLGTRVLVFAIAATSLNLLLGYAGMPSLGHAAFFGLGAYAVALWFQHHAITSGYEPLVRMQQRAEGDLRRR